MTTLVTIVLPAFNAAQTLGACLDSIRRQTEPRWRCLLVDDGSTDETNHIGRAYAAADQRFRVLTQPHGGLVAALNHGLDRIGEAPLVARMDADDIMHRRRLEAQLDALCSQPGLAAVGCHVRLFPRRRLRPGLRAYERWLNSIATPAELRREAFVECPIAHPTLLIRRPVIAEHRYRDEGWAEDYDLILRLLAAGSELSVVPQPLLLWRDGPARLSRTHPAYDQAQLVACKAHFLAASQLAGRDDYVLWGFGGTGKALHRALAAHGKHPCAIVELHPGRLGQVIHGAPVIPPAELPRRRGVPIVVSVAGAEARQQIRDALRQLAFRELSDFVCCA